MAVSYVYSEVAEVRIEKLKKQLKQLQSENEQLRKDADILKHLFEYGHISTSSTNASMLHFEYSFDCGIIYPSKETRINLMKEHIEAIHKAMADKG